MENIDWVWVGKESWGVILMRFLWFGEERTWEFGVENGGEYRNVTPTAQKKF